MREQGRISVAQMQPSGGTRRETGDRMHKRLTASRSLWCHDGVTQTGECVADQERKRVRFVSRVLGATGVGGGVSRTFSVKRELVGLVSWTFSVIPKAA